MCSMSLTRMVLNAINNIVELLITTVTRAELLVTTNLYVYIAMHDLCHSPPLVECKQSSPDMLMIPLLFMSHLFVTVEDSLIFI